MLHDARALANLVLDYADSRGISVTPLKLQKLLYFMHGHSWRLRGVGLVFNSFEAWDHGPVVKVVYDEFKALGDAEIECRAQWFNFSGGGRELARVKLAADEMRCLSETVEMYGRVDAYTLSRLSHEPCSPWDLVRRTPNKFPKRIIPDHMIARCFVEGFPGVRRQ
ncbi:Panacea domain-containing protein [Reyranella sp.]|uniref:Panacea domain-containing protein n=1 Tax=Reyranella sp. TaxID=1929291 RepID=UPI003BAC742A